MPLTFTLTATLPQSPDDIAAGILDLDNWPQFKGWGPIPGIRSASFDHRTDAVVGTRIAVICTDGSTHVEEITEWNPPHRLALRLCEFSRPLSLIAREFHESWSFEGDAPTRVTRELKLTPRSAFSKPVLFIIRPLLKQAIRAQLRQLADQR